MGLIFYGFEFRVSGLGFGVSGLEFRGSWFRVSGFRFQLSGFGLRVSGFGFRISGCFRFRVTSFDSRVSVSRSGFWVSGVDLRFSGFGFRVSILRFRVSGSGVCRRRRRPYGASPIRRAPGVLPPTTSPQRVIKPLFFCLSFVSKALDFGERKYKFRT